MTEHTTLYMTVDDGETSFDVPTDWLKDYVKFEYNMTLDEFMNEYTTDESDDVYAAGILKGYIDSRFWSVIRVNYDDAAVYDVDLFCDYEDAQRFMHNAAQEMKKESLDGITFEDYGDKIIAIDGDDVAYHWVMKPVNVH